MITIGIVCAAVLGVFGVLRQAESKPTICPACQRRTLIADRNGVIWRCVPCTAQFVYWRCKLVPRGSSSPTGDEAIPTATLRKPDDD